MLDTGNAQTQACRNARAILFDIPRQVDHRFSQFRIPRQLIRSQLDTQGVATAATIEGIAPLAVAVDQHIVPAVAKQMIVAPTSKQAVMTVAGVDAVDVFQFDFAEVEGVAAIVALDAGMVGAAVDGFDTVFGTEVAG